MQLLLPSATDEEIAMQELKALLKPRIATGTWQCRQRVQSLNPCGNLAIAT